MAPTSLAPSHRIQMHQILRVVPRGPSDLLVLGCCGLDIGTDPGGSFGGCQRPPRLTGIPQVFLREWCRAGAGCGPPPVSCGLSLRVVRVRREGAMETGDRGIVILGTQALASQSAAHVFGCFMVSETGGAADLPLLERRLTQSRGPQQRDCPVQRNSSLAEYDRDGCWCSSRDGRNGGTQARDLPPAQFVPFRGSGNFTRSPFTLQGRLFREQKLDGHVVRVTDGR